MAYNYNTIKCAVDDGIALVSINRPESLNALNKKVFTELGDVFDDLEKDDQARVVVLTGEGGNAFAAGADITEMRNYSVMEAKEFAIEE